MKKKVSKLATKERVRERERERERKRERYIHESNFATRRPTSYSPLYHQALKEGRFVVLYIHIADVSVRVPGCTRV